MPRTCLVVLLLLAGTAGPGVADPLRSAACLQALDALTDAEDRAKGSARQPGAAAAPPRLAAVTQARRKVALACLGSPDLRPPAARPRAPIEVGSALRSPTVPASGAPPPPGRVGPGPVGAPVPPPLLTLTVCDASGCWASDGTRLQRQGELLLGPRGYCSRLGAVLTCP